jgi:glyoxylase-like metal-dependent hydrolase (beta-lactamase superfamily II)
LILKRLVVGHFGSNCYIVGSEKSGDGLIIDPGAQGKDILSSVRELGLNIKFIVITHGHVDHIGALKEVKEGTGAQVAIHADDTGFLRRLSVATVYNRSFPPSPEKLLGDGDGLDIDELHFEVLHTPGHSPGGICLLGHGVVFSGDTLFKGSIGRADFPSASHHQLMSSIYIKLLPLADDTIVLPGHGPETTIGAERRSNPFLRAHSI